MTHKLLLYGLLAATMLLTNIACTEQVAQQSSNSANEQLVQAYFSTFNSHKWQLLSKMYSDSAEFKDPSLGIHPVYLKQTEIESKYTQLNNYFPELSDEIQAIYPSGEKHIIVEFISRGKSGDTLDFELPIITVFTIENGLITKDYTYYNNTGND